MVHGHCIQTNPYIAGCHPVTILIIYAAVGQNDIWSAIDKIENSNDTYISVIDIIEQSIVRFSLLFFYLMPVLHQLRLLSAMKRSTMPSMDCSR